MILLSILKASTLRGLFNQSSGEISKPVNADILSISNIYSSTKGSCVASGSIVVDGVSEDETVVGGKIISSSDTSALEEHATNVKTKIITYTFFI